MLGIAKDYCEVSIENGDEFTDVTFYGSRSCDYANLFNASADMYAEMEREVSRLESQLIDAETSGKADLIQREINRKLNILAKARG